PTYTSRANVRYLYGVGAATVGYFRTGARFDLYDDRLELHLDYGAPKTIRFSEVDCFEVGALSSRKVTFLVRLAQSSQGYGIRVDPNGADIGPLQKLLNVEKNDAGVSVFRLGPEYTIATVGLVLLILFTVTLYLLVSL